MDAFLLPTLGLFTVLILLSSLFVDLKTVGNSQIDLIGNLGTIDYKTADSKEIIVAYER